MGKTKTKTTCRACQDEPATFGLLCRTCIRWKQQMSRYAKILEQVKAYCEIGAGTPSKRSEMMDEIEEQIDEEIERMVQKIGRSATLYLLKCLR